MKGRVEREFVVDEKFQDQSMSMSSSQLLIECGRFSFATLNFLSLLVLRVGAFVCLERVGDPTNQYR
jgi:hypothetical protein